MGYAVFTNRNLDFHTRVIDFTEDLNYSAYRLPITIRVINNFHAHYLAQFSVELSLGRYQNIVTDALIFRSHNENAVLI